MSEMDALERAPRFLPSELWDAIKAQYNQSQLQSVHSVLNNYNVGISLLQGPPGTGKTKTIMGLLSGFLALQPPALAIMPSSTSTLRSSSAIPTPRGDKSGPSGTDGVKSSGEFSNFQAARELASSDQTSVRPTFSLSSVTSAMGSILRRSDSDSTASAPKKTTIQALKNVTTVRSRLEDKLSARKPAFQASGGSSLVVRQRVISSNPAARVRRSNNILLCAPSNGAVDELVLRIVTDGLMDSSGKVMKVRAPSVHPEALSEDWLSVVRLGNPGEDAPDIVKSVCLPQIIKRELEIHPKSVQLRELQETQQTLRKSIRDFHQKAKEAAERSEGGPRSRKGLAQIHAQLTKCSGEVRRLRDEVFALRTKMTAAILSRASIIACTLSKSGSGPLSGLQRGFDALIIDEAAQAVELSTLVPIRERVARVVLVGDPKQLPATVKSVVAANARYDRSLFERIAESGVAPSMLRVQYRMHPFLREFPSKRFYGGMLTDGPSVMERVLKVCPGVYKFPCFQPFLLYDVANSSEEDMNGSKYNRVEAQFCIDICQNMFQMCAEARKNNWSVGFVSPYKEQVRVLRRELGHSNIPQSVSVEVNTVDGFQGREKDVIIFSCVRASKRGGIGFLKDIRRLNVAITRARFCLFLVGHVNTLVRDETWAALVRSAQDRRLVVRTRGSNFSEVSRRLESDESKNLVEHFKEMHEKAAKKQVVPTVVPPPTAAVAAPLSGVAPSPAASAAGSVSGDSAIKLEPTDSSATATANDGSTVASEPSRGQEEAPVTADTKAPARAKLPPVDTVMEVDSTKPLSSGREHSKASPSDATVKREGGTESRHSGSDRTPRSDRDRESPRPGSEDSRSRGSEFSRSDRDRDSSRDHESHRDHQAHRDRDAYNDREPRRDRDSSRDYDGYRKREHSTSRSNDSWRDEQTRDDRSKRPRHEYSHGKYSPRTSDGSSYRRDDPRASHQQQPASGRGPMNPPKSISTKEFCLENEPPPRKTGDQRPASGSSNSNSRIETRDHPKRPREDEPRPGLFPPGHKFYAREQRSLNAQTSSSLRNGSSSNYRSVTLASTSHQRPPSGRMPSPGVNSSRPSSARGGGGGDGILGNILGSASRLASATSRVQDKTVDRSREFQ